MRYPTTAEIVEFVFNRDRLRVNCISLSYRIAQTIRPGYRGPDVDDDTWWVATCELKEAFLKRENLITIQPEDLPELIRKEVGIHDDESYKHNVVDLVEHHWYHHKEVYDINESLPSGGNHCLTSMMENTLASTLTRRMDQLIREREYDALTEEVPVTPLSPYLDRKVDFLKMDIEGMEAQVLRECGDRLKLVSLLFCEYHYGRELEDNSLAEILQLLENRGFCFEVATASAFAKSARHRFAHTGQNISELVWAKRIGNGEEEKDAE